MSPTPTLKRTVATRERRRTPRFPLSIPVHYTAGRLRGEGVTCQVSSGGVVIKTDRLLPAGRRLQLCMDWPATFDKGRRLLLMMEGKVRRSTADGIAVQILRYNIQSVITKSVRVSQAH